MSIILKTFLLSLIWIITPPLSGGLKAKSIDNTEFSKLTGSVVLANDCDDPKVNGDEYDWLTKVNGIKLSLNNEKYFKSIVDKAGKSVVSGRTTKYWKIGVQFEGTDCVHKGKYRLTGDLKDHIGDAETTLNKVT